MVRFVNKSHCCGATQIAGITCDFKMDVNKGVIGLNPQINRVALTLTALIFLRKNFSSIF